MHVDIFKTETSGAKAGLPVLMGKVVWDGKQVQFLGLSRRFVETLEEGIVGPRGGRRGLLFPKDGIEFMEGLQYEFSGGYLRATEIIGGK